MDDTIERLRNQQVIRLDEWRNGTTPTEHPRPIRTYDVHVLHRDRREDWHWHPYAMQRVHDFCVEHEPQANPYEVTKNLRQAFVMDDPALIVLAFFMDETLIGHMLCDRGTLYYNDIITVHQYALDRGVPAEIRNEATRLVKQWGKYRGPDGNRQPSTFIQWLVRDKRLVPIYKRFFKAKAHLLLMRTPIQDEE